MARNSKTLTAKQAAMWQKKTEDALIAIGATPDEHDAPPSYRSFSIDTIHGQLRLFPRGDAIRSRFEVVPKVALHGASLNPFSGKWNFEFGIIPTENELSWAIRCIKSVLIDKAGPPPSDTH